MAVPHVDQAAVPTPSNGIDLSIGSGLLRVSLPLRWRWR